MPPKSFKPEPEYRKPTIPMDSNTVYKNSFFGPVAEDIKICRMKPYLPVNSLHSSNSKIEEHSITKVKTISHYLIFIKIKKRFQCG